MDTDTDMRQKKRLPTGTPDILNARFAIGDVVCHKFFNFRGVIFDVDPVFANSEEWYDSIPKDMRPSRNQPFYHLLAENDDSTYTAYVSQQNLIADRSDDPVTHPDIGQLFKLTDGGKYQLHNQYRH